MLHTFLKGSKLRAWLSRSDCPPAIKECKVLFDRTYGVYNDRSGAVVSVEDDPRAPDNAKATNVPQELRALTSQHRAIIRAHLKHDGIIYSRNSTNVGNSQVMFYPDGILSRPAVPGIIKYIFEDDGAMFFAVQRRYESSGRKIDVFASYPHFPAKLYQVRLLNTLEKVRISWVMGHYACWQVSGGEVVVLSLCRVSSLSCC